MNEEQINTEAMLIQQMLSTQGWKVMQDEATQRKNKLTEALVWENEPERKSELQANIRSMIFFLRFPEEVLETARKVNEAARENDSPHNEEPPAAS